MIERFTLLSVRKPITYSLKSLSFLILVCLLLPGLTYAQPANNDCASAEVITDLSGGCSGFNFDGATTDLLNGDCTAAGVGSVNTWFQFTAAGSELTINSNSQG
ncbi:MAG: hypothetical protein AB8F74_19470, partial [Saprospiraceae bacterium]